MSAYEISLQTDTERTITKKITAEEMIIVEDGIVFINRLFGTRAENVAFFPHMKINYAIKLEDWDEKTEGR